jgi:hypothetical protein
MIYDVQENGVVIALHKVQFVLHQYGSKLELANKFY